MTTCARSPHSRSTCSPAPPPAEAAENDGVTIDLDRIVAAFREIAARPGVTVLVEGAGGLFVPLTDRAHGRPRRALACRS